MASALELAKAERIGQMPDEAPSHRINQILAAKDFNEAELFALAGTHPVLVQHFTDGELKLATDYLLSLDGAELQDAHRWNTDSNDEVAFRQREEDSGGAVGLP